MKKIGKFLAWFFGIVLALAIILAALILRPVSDEETAMVSPEEMRSVMSATGKLSSAMFRGMREPEKTFTVILNPGETRALLASLRRLADPYLGEYVNLRAIATEEDLVVCRAEVPLKCVMVPAVVKARGKISGGIVTVEFDSIRLGALPIPASAAQYFADRELKKFLATPEGKILPDFVSRAEFKADGSLEIAATAQGFKFLRERLLKGKR